MKAYITKYFLSKGILKVDAEYCDKLDPHHIRVDAAKPHERHFHGDEWFLTEDEARENVLKRIAKALVLLNRKKEKLSNFQIKVHDMSCKEDAE